MLFRRRRRLLSRWRGWIRLSRLGRRLRIPGIRCSGIGGSRIRWCRVGWCRIGGSRIWWCRVGGSGIRRSRVRRSRVRRSGVGSSRLLRLGRLGVRIGGLSVLLPRYLLLRILDPLVLSGIGSFWCPQHQRRSGAGSSAAIGRDRTLVPYATGQTVADG